MVVANFAKDEEGCFLGHTPHRVTHSMHHTFSELWREVAGDAIHAATNFPQKDVGAHVTMNPAAAWDDAKTGEIDCSGDEALCWKKWFDMLPPIHEALDQLNTEYLLGSVHYNRLGRYEEDYAGGHFTGEARKKEEQFQARLVLMGEEIEERNKAVGTMRNHFKYIIMMPDNIPNSINI